MASDLMSNLFHRLSIAIAGGSPATSPDAANATRMPYQAVSHSQGHTQGQVPQALWREQRENDDDSSDDGAENRSEGEGDESDESTDSESDADPVGVVHFAEEDEEASDTDDSDDSQAMPSPSTPKLNDDREIALVGREGSFSNTPTSGPLLAPVPTAPVVPVPVPTALRIPGHASGLSPPVAPVPAAPVQPVLAPAAIVIAGPVPVLSAPVVSAPVVQVNVGNVATGVYAPTVGSSWNAPLPDFSEEMDVDWDMSDRDHIPTWMDFLRQGVPEELIFQDGTSNAGQMYLSSSYPPRTMEQATTIVNHLLEMATTKPHLWEMLVGIYFQEGRNPGIHLGEGTGAKGPICGGWERNLLLQDMREKHPELCTAPYSVPQGEDGEFLQLVAATILNGNEDLFLAAIKTWQFDLTDFQPNALESILLRAGWCRTSDVICSPEWMFIASLKEMAEGPDKHSMLQAAFQRLPQFTQHYLNDPDCRLKKFATSALKMEYHSVPPEERARDPKGNLLPFGYVYKDESRNPRRPPEETGSFGKRRNARYSSTRSGTRTGTPAKRENQNVAEFGRLLALQQEEQAQRKLLPPTTSSSTIETSRKPTDTVATECILYGYKDKTSEWKVIDLFERISQGLICEDYPRTDPDIAPKYPQLLTAGDVVIHKSLSADANRKVKMYAGGRHWIKVTFDSFAAADRACHFSPQEIDGHSVYCEIYHGHGPNEDIPLPKGSLEPGRHMLPKPHTFGPSVTNNFLQTEMTDRSTIPRAFTLTSHKLDNQGFDDTTSQQSTATASSATVTATVPDNNTLRQRAPQKPQSEFMTHIPTVRRAVLRPASEALPPQPSMGERIIRSIPILSWFTGDIVGDGPVLKEDGAFDHEKSNLYWRFWHMVDKMLGTDLCGLKEDP
ncbi:hypothetical protein PRK78_006902 [Emydomyces testavorans]|uniref:Uncharacterized protein n=1 Tax=Emydomyces testavorans TaxID=2070801 RepID=A0AAF0DMP9_9EURO|nr:hypothetical protein PRK78_006902 [Emydomyces testavorans]